MKMTGKNEILGGETPVPVPLSPPKVQQGVPGPRWWEEGDMAQLLTYIVTLNPLLYLWKPIGYVMHQQFNIQQLYSLRFVFKGLKKTVLQKLIHN